CFVLLRGLRTDADDPADARGDRATRQAARKDGALLISEPSATKQLRRGSNPVRTSGNNGGCGSMVERGLPKPETRVRFPSPAPLSFNCLHKSAGKVQEDQVAFKTFFESFSIL